MIAWVGGLLKHIPFVGTLIDKLTTTSAKAEEIRAQAELEDVRGFHKSGRVSAAHLKKYVTIILACFAFMVSCVALFDADVGHNLMLVWDSFGVALKKLSAFVAFGG